MHMQNFDFHMCWPYDNADKGLKIWQLLKGNFEHERIND